MSLFSRRKSAHSIEDFLDFDIEFSGYERTGDVESARVRVLDSPMAGQGPDTFEAVEFPSGLRERARKLETRDLNLAGMKQLGIDLALVLLPGEVRNLYHLSLASLKPNQGLRIRLRLGAWALATLPWEYAYVHPRGAPEKEAVSLGFLALNRRLSLVRFEIVQGAKQSLDPLQENLLRLVALTAQPRGSADLALESETGWVEQAVDKIGDIRLDTLAHATWTSFQSELDEPAHIVHFAGHGQFEIEMGADYGTLEGQGSLLFESEAGEADTRSAQDVALILNQSGARLVVLSACEGGRVDGVRAWSGIAPALARSGVPAVVAMQFRVRDDKAIAFSRRFYENLAAGGTIDTATTAGRLAMFDSKNDYGRDWGAPVLYLNAHQGRLFPKPAGSEVKPKLTGRFVVNAILGLGLLMLGIFYYLLHLEPLLSGTYLAGGVSSLVFLGFVFLVVDRFFGTAIVDAIRRWFRKKSATTWLATACTALVALGFSTSSIFLIANEDSDKNYDVKVDAPGLSFEKSWLVQTKNKGKVFLFKTWRPVSVAVHAGTGIAQIERTLNPGWSLHLSVPDDFIAKTVTLVRLIPAKSMMNKFEMGDHIVLRISVAGKPPLEISNPSRGIMVLGDTKEEMDHQLEMMGEQLEEPLRAYLNSENIPLIQHERWLSAWSNQLTERELLVQAQDPVLVEVMENGNVIFSQQLPTANSDEGVPAVRDVFMEVQ